MSQNPSKSEYTSPSFSADVELDPSAPGTVFRNAAMIEAFMNVFGGLTMLAFPVQCLKFVCHSYTITPTATNFIQWIGGLTLALTPQLLLAIPNTRGSIESRRSAYTTLLAGEAAIIPLIMLHGSNTQMTSNSLTASVVVLGLTSLWRLYMFFVRPDWFGRYKDVSSKKD